jgi:hypothetical protein
MRETSNIKSYKAFLKEGVHWDELRREYFLLGPEDPETGAPSKGVILGKDPNTVGKDFSYEDFQNADLEGVDFSNCNLSYCDFSGAYMKGVIMDKANVTEANFSNANMRDVKGLETCKGLKTADFEGTRGIPPRHELLKLNKINSLFGV